MLFCSSRPNTAVSTVLIIIGLSTVGFAYSVFLLLGIKCDESVERLLISWEDTVVDEYLESLEEKKKATVERQVESVRDQ